MKPPYYYQDGGSRLLFFVNLDEWNALPEDYKSVFKAACRYMNPICKPGTTHKTHKRANPERASGFAPLLPKFLMAFELHSLFWKSIPAKTKALRRYSQRGKKPKSKAFNGLEPQKPPMPDTPLIKENKNYDNQSFSTSS